MAPLQGVGSSLCSIYWDYAMTIHLEEIVYLHCHQQGKAWSWPSAASPALRLPSLAWAERLRAH